MLYWHSNDGCAHAFPSVDTHASSYCLNLGLFSLTIFTLQLKLDSYFILLSSKSYWYESYIILYMSWQLCCFDMCKICNWFSRDHFYAIHMPAFFIFCFVCKFWAVVLNLINDFTLSSYFCWCPPLSHIGSQDSPGGCFTKTSRAHQNNLAKMYNHNHIYGDNFKLKLCMCTQNIALGTHSKFQLEILLRSMISVIHKFRENILESSQNVIETTPWVMKIGHSSVEMAGAAGLTSRDGDRWIWMCIHRWLV